MGPIKIVSFGGAREGRQFKGWRLYDEGYLFEKIHNISFDFLTFS